MFDAIFITGATGLPSGTVYPALRRLEDARLVRATWEDENEDWAEKDSIRLVGRDEIRDLLETQDVIFNF